MRKGPGAGAGRQHAIRWPDCGVSAGGAASARGFTLVEVLVAFSLLAVALGILLSILSNGMHAVSRASDSTRASLYAESVFESLGADRRLRIGRTQGSFENRRYQWTLDVDPAPTPAPGRVAGGANPAIGPAITGPGENVLFHLVLQMQWNGGGSGNTLRVETLRAYAPPQDLNQ